MKYHLLLLITFFSTDFIKAQVNNCHEFKTGVFQFPGTNGGVYTIIRTDTSQFERNSRKAQYSKMKIRWETPCYYTLYDLVEYKWGKQPVKDSLIMEMGNILYKFEKPNRFFIKTFVPGFSDTIETIFTKLDTNNCYNNLFQLSAFSEYKNSNAYGQILLGEIHSIEYYESNKIPNKYLIVFETTYHGENLNKSRLLDSTVVQLRDKENITNSNCRFEGRFDDEIIAIYKSKDENKEAKIIRAWRCNRKTEKIEEVDVKKVQYKEIDRKKMTNW